MPTALITGSSRGLGLEFVRQFAGAGCDVIATCKTPAAATALQQEAAASGGKITVHQLDAANRTAIFDLAKRLEGRPIDYLVANAAISPNKRIPLAEVDEAEWLEVFRTNTLGPSYLAAAFAPAVAASGRRVMAFISTRMTVLPENVAGSYYMYRSSKGALNQVIRNLSIELGPQGVSVVALHPGFVRTDMGGERAAIEPAASVAGLLKVLFHADATSNGRLYDWNGQHVNW